MPLTIKRTNTTSIAANSVQFNGSTQYLNTPSDSNFTFGTGSFTMEFWCNYTLSSAQNLFARRFLSQGANSLTRFQIWIADTSYTVNSVTTVAGGILLAHNDPSVQLVGSVNAYNDGGWHHVAFTRNGETLYCFVDGVLKQSVSNSTNFSSISPLNIGGRSDGGRFAGNISNLRILKGTALYTASFAPSTTPLTAIANTALLTCHDTTIRDASTNNFTITNNGSATVSSLSPTFRASNNNFQFDRRTSTIVGKSVLFNGTNQSLTAGAASNWTFLNNGSSWTAECWFNVPSVSLSNQYTLISTNAGSAAIGTSLTLNNTTAGDVKAVVYKGVSGQTAMNVTTNSGRFTPNTWNHVAAVYNSITSVGTVYVNGVAITSASGSGFSTSAPTYTLAIGRYQFSTPAGYLDGYISNLRIANSVLYTASFSVPTSPLTAIANTSLLTCNAATIVDASSNNFTITNNNGATVSSITPFTVASSGGMTLKKVYADPLFRTQKALFGYGFNGSNLSMTNLVSNTGVVATDTTGVGTARHSLAAAGYGTDKAIFGYGIITGGGTPNQSITNLVSNVGVVATDTTGVGTARYALAASGYGTDKAIFGYGTTGTNTSITNLVSNTGVVATDTAGVGTARFYLAAAGYGTDKAIFGYGLISSNPGVSMTNLVSNTGVVSTDTTGVGSARFRLGASGYGTDKAIFGYGANGSTVSMTNKVSNTGVVATDTTGVGTARESVAAGYGTDKAIFGYGYSNGFVSMTNLVSNTGVVANDTTGVGTARSANAAAGYSLS